MSRASSSFAWVAVAALVLVYGCGGGGGTDSGADGASPDGAAADGAAADGAAADGAVPDGAAPDGGTPPTPAEFTFCDGAPTGTVMDADPTTYRALLGSLAAGDTLRLAAGSYTEGLPIRDLEGVHGNCIVIEGPASGDAAVFVGSSSRNTVSIRDSSYVVIRNLELDGAAELGDGVKAEGDSAFAHHIVVEGLFIHDHGANQQIVGISTKCPAWRWVVRGNRIEGAGTGMYFGNSDGAMPFVGGLIEGNVVLDTVGYNMQIKHQNPRPSLAGMPAAADTIVRHNVFSKQNGASGGGSARPNVLFGHLPTSGDGVDDTYVVYGNFFYDNPSEALLQAEGNLAIYANVFFNPSGPAVHIQPHNDVPRRVHIFRNTIVADARGLRVTGGAAGFPQRVVGNAIFAGNPLSADDAADNVTDSLAAASGQLVAPGGAPGAGLDLHPQPGSLAAAVDLSGLGGFLDADLDFDGRAIGANGQGAYGTAGGGAWSLAREPKAR